MKNYIELDVLCADTDSCITAIISAVNEVAPMKSGSKFTGHVSVFHAPHKHQIWVIHYDTDGEHEGANLEEEIWKAGKTYERVETRKEVTDISRATAKSAKDIRFEDVKYGIKRVRTITLNPNILKSPVRPTKNALETKIITKLTANPDVEVF